MQGDLLEGFPEINYTVHDVKKKLIWNEQNQMYDEFVISCRTVGKDFKLSGKCKNCVPPWEICPSGCPDAIQIP